MKWSYDRGALAEFILERLPTEESFGEHYTAIGLEDNGVIKGAVAFYNYLGRDIELSIAVDTHACLRPEYTSRILDYPFNELGCERVTCVVHSGNRKSIIFLNKLGFIFEGVKRGFYPDGDAVIYGMLKKECNWRHGWISTKTSTCAGSC